MCCELGHVCNCRAKVTCHTCNQEIAADDFRHIDRHIDEAEDVICRVCYISIPSTPNWHGLCDSCRKDGITLDKL